MSSTKSNGQSSKLRKTFQRLHAWLFKRKLQISKTSLPPVEKTLSLPANGYKLIKMEVSKWSDIEIKDDCQVACCGLRAHTISYSQLSDQVQRFCDIGQFVYKKGTLEHSRRVLRVKIRRTQVVLESAASNLSRCDNFGPSRKNIDSTEHQDCRATLDWEDKAPIRSAVYALESRRLQWPEISDKIRQNVKVAIAGLNSKQFT